MIAHEIENSRVEIIIGNERETINRKEIGGLIVFLKEVRARKKAMYITK